MAPKAKTERSIAVRYARCLVPMIPLILACGCAVPQRPGGGELSRCIEPTTGRGYWLYIPKAYSIETTAKSSTQRWPLVLTFHGMKPFDTARAQAREWEREADRYGFLVVAPELRSADLLAQFPLRTVHPSFASDEEATLAILDHVFRTTRANRRHVLATSWSSGGYMAHYMLNQHPHLITCVAVRQSNFSSTVLDSTKVPASLSHPILIVNTENDFAICKKESKEAVRWYQDRGYQNLSWLYLSGIGHERTPDVAADFFAHVSGVRPNQAPVALARRRVIAGELSDRVFASSLDELGPVSDRTLLTTSLP